MTCHKQAVEFNAIIRGKEAAKRCIIEGTLVETMEADRAEDSKRHVSSNSGRPRYASVWTHTKSDECFHK